VSDDIGLVQVSDFIPNQETVMRDVPGEGIVPIEKILDWILETGYNGLFDLELYRRPSESAVNDTQRGVEWLSACLERLGVGG